MKFTPQETKVIELTIEGKTQPQIAKILNIKPQSVYSALGHARRKAGALTDRALILRFKEMKND